MELVPEEEPAFHGHNQKLYGYDKCIPYEAVNPNSRRKRNRLEVSGV